jgi:acyl carrier protein
MEAKNLSKEIILNNIISILKDITCDCDMEFNAPLGPDTKLISELAFGSIDVVQFVVAIEECFKRRKLPFEELVMIDGRYVDEIKVSAVVEFLYQHLNNGEGSGAC